MGGTSPLPFWLGREARDSVLDSGHLELLWSSGGERLETEESLNVIRTFKHANPDNKRLGLIGALGRLQPPG